MRTKSAGDRSTEQDNALRIGLARVCDMRRQRWLLIMLATDPEGTPCPSDGASGDDMSKIRRVTQFIPLGKRLLVAWRAAAVSWS